MKEKKAVILLSGGLDSSTAAAIAKKEGFTPFALSFNYGQRHGRELESARDVARHLGIGQHLVISFDMGLIGGSALTSSIPVPKGGLPAPERTAGTIPATYVPARNTIFLSFALAWAETIPAADIFIGANVMDYSGYPDCRPEYLRAFEAMANLATRASVEGKIKFSVRAPLLRMTKAEIIRAGAALGLDYSLTWSCYDPEASGRPCGRCDSCLYRAKGFAEAGLPDPLLEKFG
ncbi:MAG: 7-cyano-7-deazaguanine synthase QueC [Nitrospiraceae bacterium]|nr:7-cyano-7-deazaguanine synthase QueC [Nitrospiraceae bacterium]